MDTGRADDGDTVADVPEHERQEASAYALHVRAMVRLQLAALRLMLADCALRPVPAHEGQGIVRYDGQTLG